MINLDQLYFKKLFYSLIKDSCNFGMFKTNVDLLTTQQCFKIHSLIFNTLLLHVAKIQRLFIKVQ